jgi:hypothetical protein
MTPAITTRHLPGHSYVVSIINPQRATDRGHPIVAKRVLS